MDGEKQSSVGLPEKMKREEEAVGGAGGGNSKRLRLDKAVAGSSSGREHQREQDQQQGEVTQVTKKEEAPYESSRSVKKRITVLKEELSETQRNIEEQEGALAQLRGQRDEMRNELAALKKKLSILEQERALERRFFKMFEGEGRDPLPFLLSLEKLQRNAEEARSKNTKVTVNMAEVVSSLITSLGKDPSAYSFRMDENGRVIMSRVADLGKKDAIDCSMVGDGGTEKLGDSTGEPETAGGNDKEKSTSVEGESAT